MMKPDMIGAMRPRNCTPGGFCNPTNRKKRTGTILIRQAAKEAIIRLGGDAPSEYRDGFTFGSQSPERQAKQPTT